MRLATGDVGIGGGTRPVPANSPPALAPRPPLEATGARRDEARLLVAWRSTGRIAEARMTDIADFLEPGDVLVVNTSTTRPAALVIDDELVVHLSTNLGDGLWVVEPRHVCGAGSTPWLDYRPEPVTLLPGGGLIRFLEPYRPAAHAGRPVRLWTARLTVPRPFEEHLARFGRPIRYGCDAQPWPLDAYQTVFATHAGSAEMPSAARGFTPQLVTELVAKGVVVAPILLHTGVASQEAGETPYAEWYRVPDATAAAINTAHALGQRVITVGTTATRAVETVAERDGNVGAGEGWTELVITPERGVYAVDGLITGWHDPEASHLLLVEAVAGRALLDDSYEAAIAAGFNGHEFGDFHLILP